MHLDPPMPRYRVPLGAKRARLLSVLIWDFEVAP